jgi:hypothetical protein
MRPSFPARRNKMTCKFSLDVEYMAAISCRMVTVYTMIYCGLNWWHYRQITQKAEEETKPAKETKKK